MNCVWEIKTAHSAMLGSKQLQAYRNALGGGGLFVEAGGPREGAEGKVFAPGGHLSFGVYFQGVIRYHHIR
ncbi:hypothetical protein Enr13x_14190 [Stieleria neptunia]|uniref:Uncharacterized protein n=1 Tax=Stieleria neptunia TaxID=2527979 RepID=A0A518HL50_9BACT|nr:hypothetical protein [Stieleria neptunia]QDV41576.1 hypothetical protein Enr13x_14190 [Stieleria neptunia]